MQNRANQKSDWAKDLVSSDPAAFAEFIEFLRPTDEELRAALEKGRRNAK